jgi:hypothetical protein
MLLSISAALLSQDRISKFARGIEPQPDRFFGIGKGRFLRIAVGHTPRQFGHFGDEDPVFFAPVKDDFVFIHWFTSHAHFEAQPEQYLAQFVKTD